MTHVLITGMTASQASMATLNRTNTFSRQIAQALRLGGHTYEILLPAQVDDLSRFGSILIGIAPILGLGSNHAFPALKLINRLKDDPRLRFFIDAPMPSLISGSLMSALKNPAQLRKPLFAKRVGVPQSFIGWAEIDAAVEFLVNGEWPATLVPVMPWYEADEWLFALPDPETNLVGVNLDNLFNLAYPKQSHPDRLDIWLSNLPKSSWTLAAMKSINHGVTDIKPSRFANDSATQARMMFSTGLLLAPERDKRVWWSPRVMQALTVGTPVSTDWRDAYRLSTAWATLPGAVEELNVADREILAYQQLDDYIGALGQSDHQIDIIVKTLTIL